MGKKNIIIFIIIALMLIGFTIYSIVQNDLTIVQEIFGMQTKTAVSDEIVQDEPKKELQELGEIAPTETSTNFSNLIEDNSKNKTQNNINIINTTNSTISEAKESSINVSNNANSNTITNSITNVNSTKSIKENNSIVLGSSAQTNTNISNTYKTNSVNSTNTLNNNNNSNNTTNNVSNSIDKSIVNKNKLPAAGVKTTIIWIVVTLAIISIISNIKYKNIPLK